MYHPILNKAWKLTIYILLWGLAGTMYFLILNRYFLIDLHIAAKESFIHAALLGLLNIGTWYFIKYNRFEEKSFLNILFYFLVSCFVILGIWILSAGIFMEIIILNKQTYGKFFFQTLTLKIGFGLVLYFSMTLLYYLLIYYQKNKENIVRKTELTSMLNALELSNLKSQINPHFLFNSLNSISSQIYSNPVEAHESIVKLSDYFRYSLSTGEKMFTTLREELDNVNRYLDIEKIRFSDKMIVVKEIDETCLNFNVPVMLLQPVFENAVKHGVYESTEQVLIKVNIVNYSDFFSIIVSNNFDPDITRKKGTSTGLKNIRRRLNFIYKREDLLYISQTNNTFEVKILLPKS